MTDEIKKTNTEADGYYGEDSELDSDELDLDFLDEEEEVK